MAKVSVKKERINPFGGIYHVMDIKILPNWTKFSYFIDTFVMPNGIAAFVLCSTTLVENPQMAKLRGTYCSPETYKEYW